MSRTLSAAILRLVSYIKAHPQFLFTLLLIVCIPVAFLYSGQKFLTVSQENIERVSSDRIGLLHDVFADVIIPAGYTDQELQAQLEAVAAKNDDLRKLRILKDEAGGLVVVAALNTELVGSIESNQTPYKTALFNEEVSVRHEFIDAASGERLWHFFRVAYSSDGATYYLFTEQNLEGLDALFAARVTEAYVVLLGLLLIVLFLVYRHMRLIDYGYLYKEADAAIKTRDLFTNMVTHELRAPLTAMRGFSSMIVEDKEASVASKEKAERILQSSSRLLLIVNDLLEVARLQSGKLKIEKAETDISEIVRKVASELEASAAEKAIAIEYELPTEEALLHTDGKRLHQALINIVSNAIKYTKEGEIVLALTTAGDGYELRIKDTGMGIDAASQKNLFAPFFRVASEDVSQITGSGLGMWITRQLIDLLGGTIAVESIKGVGTHVIVRLPK